MLQLIFTSTPKGLLQGRSGFCTVAMTNGFPKHLVPVVENLSAYERLYAAEDMNAERNPVNYRFMRQRLGSQEYAILSRIETNGPGYSGRGSSIASHILLTDAELASLEGTPSQALACDENFRWSGEVGYLPMERHLAFAPKATADDSVSEKLFQYPNLAKTLAWRFRNRRDKPYFLAFDPLKHTGQDILAFIDEVSAFLTPLERQQFTYTTYCHQTALGNAMFIRAYPLGSPFLGSIRRFSEDSLLTLGERYNETEMDKEILAGIEAEEKKARLAKEQTDASRRLPALKPPQVTVFKPQNIGLQQEAAPMPCASAAPTGVSAGETAHELKADGEPRRKSGQDRPSQERRWLKPAIISAGVFVVAAMGVLLLLMASPKKGDDIRPKQAPKKPSPSVKVPAAAKPVAVKPAAVKPVAVKPVAVKPVAVKPVAVKSAAVKLEAASESAVKSQDSLQDAENVQALENIQAVVVASVKKEDPEKIETAPEPAQPEAEPEPAKPAVVPEVSKPAAAPEPQDIGSRMKTYTWAVLNGNVPPKPPEGWLAYVKEHCGSIKTEREGDSKLKCSYKIPECIEACMKSRILESVSLEIYGRRVTWTQGNMNSCNPKNGEMVFKVTTDVANLKRVVEDYNESLEKMKDKCRKVLREIHGVAAKDLEKLKNTFKNGEKWQRYVSDAEKLEKFLGDYQAFLEKIQASPKQDASLADLTEKLNAIHKEYEDIKERYKGTTKKNLDNRDTAWDFWEKLNGKNCKNKDAKEGKESHCTCWKCLGKAVDKAADIEKFKREQESKLKKAAEKKFPKLYEKLAKKFMDCEKMEWKGVPEDCFEEGSITLTE